MIDQGRARAIADEYLSGPRFGEEREFIRIFHQREEPFGWVFFFNDRRFTETGDTRYALKGNIPLVVLRSTGEVCRLPWNPNIEAAISTFVHALETKTPES